MRGAEQGPQKTEMCRGFSALSSPLVVGCGVRPRPLTACRLARLRECKLNANTESRIRKENKAVPECGAATKYDDRAQH